MGPLLLFIYILVSIVFGSRMVKWLIKDTPLIFFLISSYLIGTCFAVPLTYGISILFSGVSEPLFYAVISTSFLLAMADILLLKSGKNSEFFKISFNFIDISVIIFALLFSSWLMFKTFHGAGGHMYVGSNNVFDFGNAIGTIRSFSWGGNIPMSSPFQAGLPFFYHFYFYFYAGIWEYFSVPIIWAVNLPSILAFSSFLVLVYFLPQLLFGSKPIVGIISLLLTITNSTLSFWHFIYTHNTLSSFVESLRTLQEYPFAGPYDGSVISIYFSLNNFINQRHLAFGIALGLFLVVSFILNAKNGVLSFLKVIFYGICTGFMIYWSIPLSLLIAIIFVLMLVWLKNWSKLLLYAISFLIFGIGCLYPFIVMWKSTVVFLFAFTAVPLTANNSWSPLGYLWENLGLLPVVACLGYLSLPKKQRFLSTPLVLSFVFLCIFAVYNSRGFDQKFLSFLIIIINVIASVGIYHIYEKYKLAGKVIAPILMFVLIVSGVVNLFVVKNEFSYPFIDDKLLNELLWIRDNTPEESVFVSYSDIIDPVVIAGRKNYFGFFGNVGQSDRSGVVSAVYLGDLEIARKNGISYVLIPDERKTDFDYAINRAFFEENVEKAYAANGISIYKL